jgi:ferredoxin/flavodoxin---NADP+ reductase
LINTLKGSLKMKNRSHKVIKKRRLTNRTFVLQVERDGLAFEPGQHLNIGLPDDRQQREYSVYSSVNDNYLEILVHAIPAGHVSSRLCALSARDHVLVSGPHGRFTLDQVILSNHPLYLIATGTGIAPFHCFSRSLPQLDYHILHGVRGPSDCYDCSVYPKHRYTACFSQSSRGGFSGRVTDYLESHPIDLAGHYYLCGNSDMIYSVFSILTQAGVSREQIHTEVYF